MEISHLSRLSFLHGTGLPTLSCFCLVCRPARVKIWGTALEASLSAGRGRREPRKKLFRFLEGVVSLFLGDPVCLCRLLHRTPQLKQLHNWTAMTLARGPHGR